ncbi:MAG: DUF2782 domain-containing protein [Rudaea sp.]|nr:DUF2782 domain-containing protein [Rudaea sp.]
MKPVPLSNVPMSKIMLSMSFVLAMTGAVAAQDRGAQAGSATTAVPPVQAPPGLDDPGLKPGGPAVALPTPEAQAKAAVEDTRTNPTPKPADSPGLPPDVQAAANAAELPVVTVRQQGNETVEEYRKHGQLVFVRVLSDHGPARYYVDNPSDVPPSMQQLSGPSGVVQPVYYKLFEWK